MQDGLQGLLGRFPDLGRMALVWLTDISLARSKKLTIGGVVNPDSKASKAGEHHSALWASAVIKWETYRSVAVRGQAPLRFASGIIKTGTITGNRARSGPTPLRYGDKKDWRERSYVVKSTAYRVALWRN